MQSDVTQTCPKLHLRIEYLNEFFEAAYPKIKALLEQCRYRSVLFNLDQCGHSHVERGTILDIMHSYPAAEIFYTFVISVCPERTRVIGIGCPEFRLTGSIRM